jgi:hypothetical protein
MKERIMLSTRPVAGSSLAFFSDGSPLCSARRESIQRFSLGILNIPTLIQTERVNPIYPAGV